MIFHGILPTETQFHLITKAKKMKIEELICLEVHVNQEGMIFHKQILVVY
ncbi:hypothetical protein HanRHA438_Chr17g0820051 [Helianthus annuus]|nr:hypothetical protein HanRHA438_Chr17g0820051 [Helianthus annuus]